MDINKIHYFFKAVEYQNFTRAANECHVAQTTMSKYIASLEQELQTTLFIRNHKNIIPTKQGLQFYEGMKKINQSYHELCQQLKQEQQIHIGVKTTDFTNFQLLESFEKNHPEIKITYSYLSEKELIAGLKSYQLDALICPHMLHFYHIDDQIKEVTLSKEKVSLVCSQELIAQYHSLENVIAYTPFITKSHEQQYYQFCREKLKQKYHQSFNDVIDVDEFPKQLLLLNLSRGFSILPTKEVEYKEQLYYEDVSLEFSDHERTSLVYLDHHQSESLKSLILHIDEKKC